MKEKKKARLARRGIEMIDAAAPDKIKENVSEAAHEVARDAVLGAVELLGNLSGDCDPEPTQAQAAAAERQVERALDAIDDRSEESFDSRLKASTAARPRQTACSPATLANLRRSFPEPARELAVLVFACADLLDDLAQGKTPKDLERREAMMLRVAELLVPHAGEALTSFTRHVVALSRKARG